MENVEYSFSNYSWLSSKKGILNGYSDHVFGATRSSNKIIEVSVQAYQSLNKKSLYELQGAYYEGVFGNDMRDQYKNDIVLSHIVILSLRSVTANQIEAVFSSATPLIKSKRYIRGYVNDGFGTSKRRKYSVVTTFHFLSGIESEYHLKGILDDLIDNYIQEQMKISSLKLKDIARR